MSQNPIDPSELTSPGTISDPALEERRAGKRRARGGEPCVVRDEVRRVRQEVEAERSEAAQAVGEVPHRSTSTSAPTSGAKNRSARAQNAAARAGLVAQHREMVGDEEAVRADLLELHVGVREAADCKLLDQLVRSDGADGVVVVAARISDLRVPAQRPRFISGSISPAGKTLRMRPGTRPVTEETLGVVEPRAVRRASSRSRRPGARRHMWQRVRDALDECLTACGCPG